MWSTESTEAQPVLEPLQLYTESRTGPALQGGQPPSQWSLDWTIVRPHVNNSQSLYLQPESAFTSKQQQKKPPKTRKSSPLKELSRRESVCPYAMLHTHVGAHARKVRMRAVTLNICSDEHLPLSEAFVRPKWPAGDKHSQNRVLLPGQMEVLSLVSCSDSRSDSLQKLPPSTTTSCTLRSSVIPLMERACVSACEFGNSPSPFLRVSRLRIQNVKLVQTFCENTLIFPLPLPETSSMEEAWWREKRRREGACPGGHGGETATPAGRTPHVQDGATWMLPYVQWLSMSKLLE